jgi:hypothetical protein
MTLLRSLIREQGYDVYLFAQRGMDASGIDVAPLAVAEAGR